MWLCNRYLTVAFLLLSAALRADFYCPSVEALVYNPLRDTVTAPLTKGMPESWNLLESRPLSEMASAYFRGVPEAKESIELRFSHSSVIKKIPGSVILSEFGCFYQLVPVGTPPFEGENDSNRFIHVHFERKNSDSFIQMQAQKPYMAGSRELSFPVYIDNATESWNGGRYGGHNLKICYSSREDCWSRIPAFSYRQRFNAPDHSPPEGMKESVEISFYRSGAPNKTIIPLSDPGEVSCSHNPSIFTARTFTLGTNWRSEILLKRCIYDYAEHYMYFPFWDSALSNSDLINIRLPHYNPCDAVYSPFILNKENAFCWFFQNNTTVALTDAYQCSGENLRAMLTKGGYVVMDIDMQMDLEWTLRHFSCELFTSKVKGE